MAAKKKITRVLDTRGLLCPQPAIIAANTLKKMETGQVLEVICDDKRTHYTIIDLCRKAHYKNLEAREEYGTFHFIIEK